MMEVSQQTPTQVNEDRDLEGLCPGLPSSSQAGDTQAALSEPRTLQGDDTGAVNFGSLSEFPRPSSQVSEDEGFKNTHGGWRTLEGTSQQFSNTGYTPLKPSDDAPETPALAVNPFAAKPNISAPFAGTQLFGQTQFSSAIKRISPTSSRPSPNLQPNDVSFHEAETSPLKDRVNISSPTEVRTSSPQRLHEVPATVPRGRALYPLYEETPTRSGAPADDVIPESPTSKQPRPFQTQQPMAHYEPMKQSQERKVDVVTSTNQVEWDSDSDGAVAQMERRKRVERKRAQAAQEMERVSYSRPSSREEEGQPRKKRRMTSDQEPVASSNQSTTVGSEGKAQWAPNGVGNSQIAAAKLKSSNRVNSTGATPQDEHTDIHGQAAKSTAGPDHDAAGDLDMIPATSPALPPPPSTEGQAPEQVSEPELPQLYNEETVDGLPSAPEETETSSEPSLRQRAMNRHGCRIRQERRKALVTSSASDGANANQGSQRSSIVGHLQRPEGDGNDDLKTGPAEQHAAQETVALFSTQTGDASAVSPADFKPHSSAPNMSRSRRSLRNTSSGIQRPSRERILDTSSPLSVLSTAPPQSIASTKTTPGTMPSPTSERLRSGFASSMDNTRQRKTTTPSSSPPLTRAKSVAGRISRVLSFDPIDEPHGSPSSTGVAHGTVSSRAGRNLKQSGVVSNGAGGLFRGMVFALSFQQQERTKLETKISQEGGTVLSDGFQELFEQLSTKRTAVPVLEETDPLRLTASNQDCGFTALLADGHSRKAKYLQALALGLPCLAHQWVTACINAAMIVDWNPYLLCAGPSKVLGDAIRSRNLVPYTAVGTRLADIIRDRPKLLGGQKMLLVTNSTKSRSETKNHRMFLAHALGPTIQRVFTVQQAHEALAVHEHAGRPFDWVYMDQGMGSENLVLDGPQCGGGGGGKRRKRASNTPSWTGRVRCLSDELVVQSLILGRMVEEGEM